MKKGATYIYTILLFLVVTLVYANHFHNGFHFDDFHSVVDNPYIRDFKNVPLFFKDGTTSSILPQNQAYRPIVTTSLALDYKMGNGYDLFHFQVSTYILFLAQGLLMLLLFNKLLSLSSSNKNISYIALFATAWYLLHPAIAETVNYIIARSDVQSTLAVVAGFVIYQYSSFCRKTFIYLLPVAIGILAKPLSVMFAPLLFFYVLLFEENMSLADIFKKAYLKQFWNVIRKTIPAFILCTAMYLLVGKFTPKTWEAGGNSPLNYLITQPYVILHYFITFFWPTGLSADSDWGTLSTIWNIRFYVGCAFILGMLITAFYTSKKLVHRPISFGILWFFISLAPTSSIIPLGEVLNDHRMFFPFIGLVISVSWALGLIVFTLLGDAKSFSIKYKGLVLIPVFILLCTCAYGTWKRNIVWHTEASLWQNVTVKSPKNGRGWMNYGIIKLDSAKYDEAEKCFNKAQQLSPNYSFIYANIGVLKEKTGDYVNAESNFLQSIELGKSYPGHFFLYGQFLYRQGRFLEAEVMLQKAIELSSSQMDARILLMKVYELLGEWNQLKDLCISTIKISPGNTEVLNYLGESQQKKGKTDAEAEVAKVKPTPEKYLGLSLDYYLDGKYYQCIAAAKEALKLKPAYVEAFNNIGCAYNALGDYDKATEVLKMAVTIKPDYYLAKNNLALSQNHKSISMDIISGRNYTAADYVNQSLLYYNQKQYELCIAACVSALIISPDDDLAYNNLCAAYIQLGQWDDAIALGEKGLKINPTNERLKNNLAQAIAEKKRNHK